MKYNWKFIRTKGGKVSICLCIGDKLSRDFKSDFTKALMVERSGNYEFEPRTQTVEKYLKEQKKVHEAYWQKNEKILPNIEFTDSLSFWAEQRKIKKEEEKATQNNS